MYHGFFNISLHSYPDSLNSYLRCKRDVIIEQIEIAKDRVRILTLSEQSQVSHNFIFFVLVILQLYSHYFQHLHVD